MTQDETNHVRQDGLDLTNPSSYEGYQSGRRIALASGCSLSSEAMSMIARLQFDKQANAIHLDPVDWVKGWVIGFQDYQGPILIVVELVERKEGRA